MESKIWRPLPAFQSLPALFARPVFSTQSYKLHLTDLANVWVEELDRKGIGRRSLNEDTSIDPTEGPDQMVMLLSKIYAAFDPSASDHDQTSISLAVPTDTENGDLVLNVTCHLPDGLEPLKWSFRLTKCPDTAVATNLMVPIMQTLHTRAREVHQLIGSLKEKDDVIDKLVDHLERAGIGLDNVFSALSGKRKPSRQLADGKVAGLAHFNKDDWHSKPLPTTQSGDDISSLVEVGFSNPLHDEDLEIFSLDVPKDWWLELGPAPVKGARREQKGQATSTSRHSPAGLQSEESRPTVDEDDDFQVQATPPQHTSARTRNTEADYDNTTDDEADAIPDSHPAPGEHNQPSLGTIGKDRKSTEPPKASGASRQIFKDDDETATDSEDEPVQSPSRHRKKASRLGNIGTKSCTGRGRKSETISPPRLTAVSKEGGDRTASDSDRGDPAEISSPGQSPKVQAPKRKLGAIGRIGAKARQMSVQPEGGSQSPESALARPAGHRIGTIGKRKVDDKIKRLSASPEPRDDETDEQKAGRKRAELAKELERKASAKPAKKKRKF